MHPPKWIFGPRAAHARGPVPFDPRIRGPGGFRAGSLLGHGRRRHTREHAPRTRPSARTQYIGVSCITDPTCGRLPR